MTVRAVDNWRTNADLIHDAWKLGYVYGSVYDATPGAGMWTRRLWASGGMPLAGITDFTDNSGFDYRCLPLDDDEFDTVFYDPPYKLNGNPSGLLKLSQRYGVEVPTSPADRKALIVAGFRECLRISSDYVLVKCQDQVCSGKMQWQTLWLIREAGTAADLVDRFDMIGHHIPQPMEGRRQVHAHGRGSTLLVFSKR